MRKGGRQGNGKRQENNKREAEARLRAAAARLAQHLDRPDAYAVPDPFDDAALQLVAPVKGVSGPVGRVVAAAAAMLVAEDRASWERGPGRVPRLVASEAGRSHLRRDKAEAGTDPFLAQHKPLRRTVLREDGEEKPVLIDDGEGPLTWLRQRKGKDGKPLIGESQFAAGERLRRDLTLSQMLPKVTAHWGEAVNDGRRGAADPASATDAMIAARQRVRAALNAVGSDFSGLLLDVCGFGRGLAEIERERGWPARSAKLLLDFALDRLAAHYGLSAQAKGPASSKGILAWGADDYRPAMD